jgi:aryl-alcohol dehydrogenase (NADP+)
MTFGYQCDDKTSFAIMDAAADAGITFFDTADAYPLGASRREAGRTEELIGEWLGSRRDEFIIASKCFFPTGKKPWDMGNSRKNIVRALDASLRRLDTDYVDLYQLHSWDTETPIDETLNALADVVRAGKVRYVGCSNFLAYQLARSIGRAEVLGTVNFVSVQPRYNLLFRENERELFPLCLDEGIAVIPYNPLAGGFLSGKHQPGAPTEGGRFTLGTAAERYQERYWHDRMFKTVDELRPVAEASGVSMATMAMQWVLANPVITSPIVGASRPAQLADSVAAVGTPIDPAVKATLDEMTHEFRFGDNAR